MWREESIFLMVPYILDVIFVLLQMEAKWKLKFLTGFIILSST